MALILLVTCALVVTDAYEEEISLILARGGSIRQVVLRVLGRTAVAAGPALVVGAAAGPGRHARRAAAGHRADRRASR